MLLRKAIILGGSVILPLMVGFSAPETSVPTTASQSQTVADAIKTSKANDSSADALSVGADYAPGQATLASKPTPTRNVYTEGFRSGECMMPDKNMHTDIAKGMQTGKILTLREAILLSLRYNPDVQNQEIGRVAEKFALRVAENEFEFQYALAGNLNQTFTRTAGVSTNSRTSVFTPEVTRNGQYGTQMSLTMNNPTTDGIYNPGIDLSLTQPLIRGFGKDVATASLYTAQEQEKVNQLNLRSTLIQDLTSVINDYRQLVVDQNQVVVDQLSLKDYAATIKMDEALIKAGRKAPTEVIQAKADYAQALFQLKEDQNSEETSRLQLLNSIGLPPETKVSVPTDIDICKDDTPGLEEAYNLALKNDISYLSDTVNVKISQRQLLVDKDNNRMQLNFNLDAATGDGSGTSPNSGLRSLSNNKNTNLSFQLDLDVPIDDYSLKQAIVDDKVQLEQDRISLANTSRELKLTIQNDLNTVQADYENIKIAKTTLDLQQKNQDYLRAQLRYGLVSTFEVTTKQQDLDSARIQYIQQKISYLNSLTQLYADIGITLEKWNVQARY